MAICQAEKEFSLGESVKKLADDFRNKAFYGILKINLHERTAGKQKMNRADDVVTGIDNYKCFSRY